MRASDAATSVSEWLAQETRKHFCHKTGGLCDIEVIPNFVDADRFLPDGNLWAGHWASPPSSWSSGPEERLLAGEARELIEATIATLPDSQRQVITLRDVDGWSSEEVCNVLDLSEVNQRVLLHRARAKLRQALEDYFDQSGETQ